MPQMAHNLIHDNATQHHTHTHVPPSCTADTEPRTFQQTSWGAAEHTRGY